MRWLDFGSCSQYTSAFPRSWMATNFNFLLLVKSLYANTFSTVFSQSENSSPFNQSFIVPLFSEIYNLIFSSQSLTSRSSICCHLLTGDRLWNGLIIYSASNSSLKSSRWFGCSKHSRRLVSWSTCCHRSWISISLVSGSWPTSLWKVARQVENWSSTL